MATCSSCGHDNPEGSRFCNGCGTELEAAPLREERKVVTVLFCDLVGFTARSDRADPEDVRAIVRPFHELLRTQTERFGGTLARIVGDAGMVVFGYPSAHEDDPERAVRTAFAIVEGLERTNAERPGLDLHARVGINTCEAVVTYGSTLEDADDLMGDGVNLAARLQSLAPPDGVVVGEATYSATSHLFAYEALEPTEVKGKAEPVAIYRPTRSLGRVGRAMQESTPFVGRELELSMLTQLLDRSRTTPSTEFVTVVADPGIGKSRLVRELARHVGSLPEPVTWRVGHCLPYGDGISFWALGEIIKAHAGIFDTDDQATLAEKLDRVLVEPDAGLRAWMRTRIAPLVGLDTTAEPPQQEEAFTAWRRFLEQIATERPLVVVIEDLHWADDALVAFLQHLAERTSGLPIFVIVTARPEVEERHPTWLGRARRSTVLPLAVLADRDMTTLVEATLEGASSELIATVLERAGGSPLYAEQLAAMLRDRALPIGGGSLAESAIPPSIQALLAARIDALSPELKATLLDASVVGKKFWSGALAALGNDPDLEAHLAELARRDFIRPAFPSTMQGELEFIFVHALVCDVAYAELPRAGRMTKHHATAAWITARAGEALGEDAEIVVAHLERARELAEMVGLKKEAASSRLRLGDALLAAATHASRIEPARATAHLRRALALIGPGDPRRAAALLALGRACLATAEWPEALRALEQAIKIARNEGEVERAIDASFAATTALYRLGQLDREQAILLDLQRWLGDGPSPGAVMLLAKRATDLMVRFQDREARQLVDRAIEMAEACGFVVPPRALVARGVVRFADEPRQGEADLRRAIQLATAQGDLKMAESSYYNLADCMGQHAGAQQGLSVLDEGLTWADAHGLPTAYLVTARVDPLFDAGRWEEAVEDAHTVLEWAEERSDAHARFTAERVLAMVHMERGEPAGRLEHLGDLARSIGGPPSQAAGIVAEAAMMECDLEAARGALMAAVREVAAGGFTAIARFVRACVRAEVPEVAQEALALGTISTPFLLAETVAAQATLAEATGHELDARDLYGDALRSFLALGVVVEQAYALAGLGRCLLALGETEEGVARLKEARELWVGMKATPRIAEIDELLMTVS